MNPKIIIAGLLVVTGWLIISSSFVSYGPGVVAPESPRQSPSTHESFYYKNIQVIPQADFEVEARVLSREDYSFDTESMVAPVDLALGWGRMSDETILDTISISQGNRFYYWRTDKLVIPRAEIIQHSANMHMIPASESVTQTIKRVKPGQVVRFKGFLVNLRQDNGWHWISSLTREDSGKGACELVWVEKFEIVPDHEIKQQLHY